MYTNVYAFTCSSENREFILIPLFYMLLLTLVLRLSLHTQRHVNYVEKFSLEIVNHENSI